MDKRCKTARQDNLLVTLALGSHDAPVFRI